MDNTIDERELCRCFSSKNFLIPTRQICDLHALVDEWIQTNSCGGIIYGPSRCGKTSAIYYVTQTLKKTYGSELPVFCYTSTTHTVTQRSFYESILLLLGHEIPSRGTANQMRERIINRITMLALETKYQMAILWIDEANTLDYKEYLWLIDLYNGLYDNDIQLTCILVGTRDLLEQKKGYIRSGQQQIVQRFLLKEAEFHGIESLTDLTICMNSLDNAFKPSGLKSTICLSEYYFPHAYSDGKMLSDYAQQLWTAWQNLRKKSNIGVEYMTMKCFMDTISYCLRKYGANANEEKRVYAPTIAEWETSLIQSGYVSSQV